MKWRAEEKANAAKAANSIAAIAAIAKYFYIAPPAVCCSLIASS